jgi:hypothetical protein
MRLITAFLALVMTLMATPVQAIEHYKFAVGTGFNLNNNKVNGDDMEDISSVSSVDLNIAAKEQLKLTDNLLFRTGIWLQEKTAKFDETGFYDDAFEFNTFYLSVPLTAEYMFNKVFSIYGGYIGDIRMNDYCRSDDDLDGCEQLKESEDVVHNATLGVTFNLGNLVALDANYQHAISDTYKNEAHGNTFSVRTNTVSLMVFFRLF